MIRIKNKFFGVAIFATLIFVTGFLSALFAFKSLSSNSTESFASGKSAATEIATVGAGTPEDPFLINTVADYAEFTYRVNVTYSYEATLCAKLMNDLDFEGATVTPIGYVGEISNSPNDNMWYNGTFDGNGHILKNMVIDTSVNGECSGENTFFHGIFGWLGYNAVVKNLAIENCTIQFSSDWGSYRCYAGILAGRMEVLTYSETPRLEDITVSNGIVDVFSVYDVSCDEIYAGGLIGYVNGALSMSSILVTDVSVKARTGVGGLIGWQRLYTDMKNGRQQQVYDSIAVSATLEGRDVTKMGGMIGQLDIYPYHFYPIADPENGTENWIVFKNSYVKVKLNGVAPTSIGAISAVDVSGYADISNFGVQDPGEKMLGYYIEVKDVVVFAPDFTAGGFFINDDVAYDGWFLNGSSFVAETERLFFEKTKLIAKAAGSKFKMVFVDENNQSIWAGINHLAIPKTVPFAADRFHLPRYIDIFSIELEEKATLTDTELKNFRGLKQAEYDGMDWRNRPASLGIYFKITLNSNKSMSGHVPLDAFCEETVFYDNPFIFYEEIVDASHANWQLIDYVAEFKDLDDSIFKGGINLDEYLGDGNRTTKFNIFRRGLTIVDSDGEGAQTYSKSYDGTTKLHAPLVRDTHFKIQGLIGNQNVTINTGNTAFDATFDNVNSNDNPDDNFIKIKILGQNSSKNFGENDEYAHNYAYRFDVFEIKGTIRTARVTIEQKTDELRLPYLGQEVNYDEDDGLIVKDEHFEYAIETGPSANLDLSDVVLEYTLVFDSPNAYAVGNKATLTWVQVYNDNPNFDIYISGALAPWVFDLVFEKPNLIISDTDKAGEGKYERTYDGTTAITEGAAFDDIQNDITLEKLFEWGAISGILDEDKDDLSIEVSLDRSTVGGFDYAVDEEAVSFGTVGGFVDVRVYIKLIFSASATVTDNYVFDDGFCAVYLVNSGKILQREITASSAEDPNRAIVEKVYNGTDVAYSDTVRWINGDPSRNAFNFSEPANILAELAGLTFTFDGVFESANASSANISIKSGYVLSSPSSHFVITAAGAFYGKITKKNLTFVYDGENIEKIYDKDFDMPDGFSIDDLTLDDFDTAGLREQLAGTDGFLLDGADAGIVWGSLKSMRYASENVGENIEILVTFEDSKINFSKELSENYTITPFFAVKGAIRQKLLTVISHDVAVTQTDESDFVLVMTLAEDAIQGDVIKNALYVEIPETRDPGKYEIKIDQKLNSNYRLAFQDGMKYYLEIIDDTIELILGEGIKEGDFYITIDMPDGGFKVDEVVLLTVIEYGSSAFKNTKHTESESKDVASTKSKQYKVEVLEGDTVKTGKKEKVTVFIKNIGDIAGLENKEIYYSDSTGKVQRANFTTGAGGFEFSAADVAEFMIVGTVAVDNTMLFVGIGIGAGLLLILLIAIVVIVVHKKRQKAPGFIGFQQNYGMRANVALHAPRDRDVSVTHARREPSPVRPNVKPTVAGRASVKRKQNGPVEARVIKNNKKR